ncbi:MAG: dephospho-CoA kinase [Acidimicrobiia bacterium]
MSDRQVRVLLTGGIGAGKSSVGELLLARGALVIDADQVGHQVLESGGEAFERVAETWPSVVVDGMIDRRRLADIVFGDPAELEKLEGFTHAAIRRRIARMIERASEQVIVVEVPLLTDFMGPGWIRVVVDADPDTRTERLRRRGMDGSDASRRMAAQAERADWVAAADVVIDNSLDPDALGAQVDAFWERLAGVHERMPEDPDKR